MYRWVEHTAELELAVEAATEEEVFAQAVVAFVELLDDGGGGPAAEHTLTVRASDRATQLADWLQELVYLAETEDFVPERLVQIELDAEQVHGTVAGHRGHPPHLVKAVTYHDLEVRPRDGGWQARVVLDV
jgi:SHS2 domain-containing protein